MSKKTSTLIKVLLSVVIVLVVLLVIHYVVKPKSVPPVNKVVLMEQKELQKSLKHLKKKQIREAWGEPDTIEEESTADIWYLYGDYMLGVTYGLFDEVQDCNIRQLPICGGVGGNASGGR